MARRPSDGVVRALRRAVVVAASWTCLASGALACAKPALQERSDAGAAGAAVLNVPPSDEAVVDVPADGAGPTLDGHPWPESAGGDAAPRTLRSLVVRASGDVAWGRVAKAMVQAGRLPALRGLPLALAIGDDRRNRCDAVGWSVEGARAPTPRAPDAGAAPPRAFRIVISGNGALWLDGGPIGDPASLRAALASPDAALTRQFDIAADKQTSFARVLEIAQSAQQTGGRVVFLVPAAD